MCFFHLRSLGAFWHTETPNGTFEDLTKHMVTFSVFIWTVVATGAVSISPDRTHPCVQNRSGWQRWGRGPWALVGVGTGYGWAGNLNRKEKLKKTLLLWFELLLFPVRSQRQCWGETFTQLCKSISQSLCPSVRPSPSGHVASEAWCSCIHCQSPKSGAASGRRRGDEQVSQNKQTKACTCLFKHDGWIRKMPE